MVPEKGDKAVVKINTAAGCSWTASSNIEWVQIKGDASGTGPHDVHYDVDRNRSRSTRIGSITIAGVAHVIVQSADH
jgi:hypothetical protein